MENLLVSSLIFINISLITIRYRVRSGLVNTRKKSSWIYFLGDICLPGKLCWRDTPLAFRRAFRDFVHNATEQIAFAAYWERKWLVYYVTRRLLDASPTRKLSKWLLAFQQTSMNTTNKTIKKNVRFQTMYFAVLNVLQSDLSDVLLLTVYKGDQGLSVCSAGFVVWMLASLE